MDPISAIIVAGFFAMLCTKAVGSAVTDVVAQSKGQTPPSLEKWRKRHDKSPGRGSRREPGPWKRRWDNAVAAHTEKAAQKHQARMDHLREHAGDNVAAHKDKLERRAQRLNAVHAKVAGWGTASWEAAKKAAAAAKERKERKLEDQAWRENECRGPESEQATEPAAEAGGGERSGDDEQAERIAAIRKLDNNDLSHAYDKATSDGERKAVREEWFRRGFTGIAATVGLPSEQQDGLARKAFNARQEGRINNLTELDALIGRMDALIDPPHQQPKATVLPFRRPGEGDDPAAVPALGQYGSSHLRLLDAAMSSPDGSVPPLPLADDEFTKDGLADLVSAGCLDKDHRLTDFGRAELARVKAGGSRAVGGETATPNGNNGNTKEGNNDMPPTPANTNTEITDLETAISYSQDTAKYSDTVAATLSDILAQLDAATAGLTAEAAQYEQAKASLSSEGFNSKVTGRFDAAAEALHAAAEGVKSVVQRVTEAAELVGSASGEMRGAVQVFSDQLALAEQIGAHQQDAGVSKRTDFYAPA